MQISSMNRMILEIPPLFFVNNQTLAPHLTLEQLSSRCFPFPATCSSELLRPPAINPSSLLRVLVAAERSHHRQLSSLGFPLDQRLPRTIPTTSSSRVHLRRVLLDVTPLPAATYSECAAAKQQSCCRVLPSGITAGFLFPFFR